MCGVRIENTMENGKITKCMGREPPNGLMEENIKDNMSMIKNMEQVLSTGQMDGNTMVLGKMANNMVEENTS